MANKLILSDEWAGKLLRLIVGKSAVMEGAETVWVGLSSNDPVSTKTFSEIPANTTTNYARTIIGVAGDTYPDFMADVSGRAIVNRKQVVFNKAKSDYSANGVGFFSAETGGKPFAYGKLNTTLNVVAGSLPMFEPGDFELSISDGTESE